VKKFNTNRYSGYLLILILLLCWEMAARIKKTPFLPAFSSTLKALYTSIIYGDFLQDIALSIFHALSGIVIACVIMIPLGMYVGKNKRAYNLFSPLIEFLRPMPSSAIIPLAIICLGFGTEMKIFVIVFGASWPILLNTINGIRSIDPMYIRTGEILGFSKFSILKHIIFPASLPSIFTGLRISISISLILSITVEMIVGVRGVGYFIIENERGFSFPEMFGGILALGLVGLMINKLFNYLEYKILTWHYEFRKK
jgi:ABC-type nitrate/sulfonate/bicarbonate transport system permease component